MTQQMTKKLPTLHVEDYAFLQGCLTDAHLKALDEGDSKRAQKIDDFKEFLSSHTKTEYV